MKIKLLVEITGAEGKFKPGEAVLSEKLALGLIAGGYAEELVEQAVEKIPEVRVEDIPEVRTPYKKGKK